MPYFNTYGLLVYDENELMHEGNENSGRYPRGSGERPFQHGGGGRGSSRFKKKETRKDRVTKATGREIGTAIKKFGSALSKGAQATRDAVANHKRKKFERELDRLERNPKKFKTKDVARLVNQMSDDELNERIKMLQQRDVYKQLIGKKTFSEIKQQRVDFINNLKNEFASSLVSNVIVPGATGYIVNKLKNKTYRKEAFDVGDNAMVKAQNRTIDEFDTLRREVDAKVRETAAKGGITDSKVIEAAIKKNYDAAVKKVTGGKSIEQYSMERAQDAREAAMDEYRKQNKPSALEEIYKNVNPSKGGGGNKGNNKGNNKGGNDLKNAMNKAVQDIAKTGAKELFETATSNKDKNQNQNQNKNKNKNRNK